MKQLRVLSGSGKNVQNLCTKAFKNFFYGEDVKSARLVLELMEMRGIPPNTAHYNSVVMMYCKRKLPQEGFKFLDVMKANGVKPATYAVNSLITTFGQQKNIAKGMTLFRTMKERGPPPDVVTFNTLLEFFNHNRQAKQVTILLAEMKTLGIQPDSTTERSLVDPFTKRAASLMAQAAQLQGSGDEVQKLYTNAITSFGRGGDCASAEAVLSVMEVRGISSNVFHFNSLIAAYCNNGESEKGLALLKSMESKGVKPNATTCNLACRGFWKAGLLEEGLELMASIETQGVVLDVAIYTSAITACAARVDKVETVLHLLETMKVRNVQPNVATYTAAIQALGKAKRTAQAWHLVSQMKKSGIEPDPYFMVQLRELKGYRGQMKHVPLELLSRSDDVALEAKEAAQLASKEKARVQAAHAIIEVEEEVAAAGDAEKRLNLVPAPTPSVQDLAAASMAQAAQLKPEGEEAQRLFTMAIHSYGKEGDWESALEVLRVMSLRGVSPTETQYHAAIAACGWSLTEAQSVNL